MDFLNAKQSKEIYSLEEKQWGSSVLKKEVLMRNKDDIYVITRDVEELDPSLRVNSMGMYVGEFRNNELRLSIEGSQLIGPSAAKNVVDVSPDKRDAWLRGNDIEDSEDASGFVILRSGDDFIGCGKMREGKILNFVPKTRRIKSRD